MCVCACTCVCTLVCVGVWVCAHGCVCVCTHVSMPSCVRSCFSRASEVAPPPPILMENPRNMVPQTQAHIIVRDVFPCPVGCSTQVKDCKSHGHCASDGERMETEDKQVQSEKWPWKAGLAEGPQQAARDKETCVNPWLHAH